MTKLRTTLTLLACVAGCLVVGGASALVRGPDDWYATLRKPTWTPPGAVFGPVWTVLYATMGVALWLVLRKGWQAGGVRWAVGVFALQLALNAVWSPIFFGLHSPGRALIVLALLWFAVAWTVAAFWSVRDLAGVLLVPYWLWTTFALALNAAIWRMN